MGAAKKRISLGIVLNALQYLVIWDKFLLKMSRSSPKLFGFLNHRQENIPFFASLYLLILASLTAIVLCAWGNQHWFTIISTSIVVSVASFLTGVLFGFIFGFPYRENEKQNNSFKDVTEWLTKIIIGLGLVELRKLYHLFHVDVLALSNSLGLGANFSVLFGALIIGYMIKGFLIGYFVTITEIFQRLVSSNIRVREIVEGTVKPLRLPSDSVTVSSPEEGANLLEESSLRELISSLENIKDYTIFEIPELKKLAGQLYKAEQYEMAAKAYEAVYEKDKSDYFSLLNAGYILSKKLFRHELANQFLDRLISSAPKYGAAYYNKACNYIRMNDFEKARENIKFALTYDATLYAMAEKDEELSPIHPDIQKIFEEIRGK